LKLPIQFEVERVVGADGDVGVFGADAAGDVQLGGGWVEVGGKDADCEGGADGGGDCGAGGGGFAGDFAEGGGAEDVVRADEVVEVPLVGESMLVVFVGKSSTEKGKERYVVGLDVGCRSSLCTYHVFGLLWEKTCTAFS